jgi:hypothetical protein
VAPPAAEQTPPQPPAVTWDTDLLTIDAENSTLTDILVAVRTRTGASIEIPLAASRERVFVHLGPGPIREIISSLLYGTGFDYIIEASEDDPDTLRSVVVTAQGMGDDSTVSSPADAVATKDFRGTDSQGVTRREGGMRMMRGWAAPGKPTFQADAEAAMAAEEANRASASASDDAGPNSQSSSATRTESASGVQDSTSDAASASSAPSSRGNANSVTESDIPPETASSSPSGAEPDDQSGISQSIQSMTRLYEQRRQIQAKQNQTGQQKQSPPN